MHERDLRRQALESGKTTSRKARSRQTSRATSRATSPAAAVPSPHHSSRNESPAGSDDGYSDQSSRGHASLPVSGNASSDDEIPATVPEQPLSVIIDNLLDKSTKRQNAEMRINNLHLYINSRLAFFPEARRISHESDLISSFIRMVKLERSKEEVHLALHALAITCVSSPDLASPAAADVFEDVSGTLKNFIDETLLVDCKATAINTLATFVFFCEAAEDEIKVTLDYLMLMISSDGGIINAPDAPGPIHAAVQEFGFLLTRYDEYEEESHDTVDVFMDQLTASDPDIQIAAVQVIALLFELSYSPLDHGEEAPEPELSNKNAGGSGKLERETERNLNKPILVKRYEAYRRVDEIKEQLENLSHSKIHGLTSKMNRDVHNNMADVLNSIENPSHGPRYRTSLSKDKEGARGSKMKIKVGGKTAGRRNIVVDTWVKFHRYEHLLRLLKKGFQQHYSENAVVNGVIESEISYDEDGDSAVSSRQYYSKTGAKMKKMMLMVEDWDQPEYDDDDGI